MISHSVKIFFAIALALGVIILSYALFQSIQYSLAKNAVSAEYNYQIEIIAAQKVEIQLMHANISFLEDSLDSLKKQEVRVNMSLTARRKEVNRLDEEIEKKIVENGGLLGNTTTVSTSLARQQSVLREVREVISNKNVEMVNLGQVSNKLLDQIDQQKIELARLNLNKDSLDLSVQQEKNTLQILEQEIRQQNSKIANLKLSVEKFEEMEQGLVRLERNYLKEKDKETRLKKSINNLEDQSASLEKYVVTLEQTKRDTELKLAEANSKFTSAYEQSFDQWRKLQDRQNTSIADLEKFLGIQKQNIDSQNSIISNYQAKQNELVIQHNEHGNKLNDLTTNLAETSILLSGMSSAAQNLALQNEGDARRINAIETKLDSQDIEQSINELLGRFNQINVEYKELSRQVQDLKSREKIDQDNVSNSN